ncbi:DNA glycosylase [Podospora appendiculata]|uniref:DNA glycosylase n=1 Tax=Podospora appendiculata TaxID=314037 RepID=A0AAE0XKU4_9PEZI|nr:DNA glycosylase [Podospora appendiculata]
MSAAIADGLLHGFDVADEATREFLVSVLISGQAPPAEVDELYRLSLMRGTEEWGMLIECATSIRKRAHVGPGSIKNHETSLLPFLDQILAGEAVHESLGCGVKEKLRLSTKRPAKRRDIAIKGSETKPRGGASHYWAEPGEGDGKKTISQQRTGVVDGSGCGQRVDETPEVVLHKIPLLDGDAEERDISVTKPQKRAQKSLFFDTPTPKNEQQATSQLSTTSQHKTRRPARGTVSGLPIPPLSAPHFGLIQEEMTTDPFRLLVAITFLIRTSGKVAIPIFRELMNRFHTPETLAAADPAEIIALIHPLGLSAVRCAKIQKYARIWMERPPDKNQRYVVKNYPRPGDGAHVRGGQEFGPEPEDGDARTEDDGGPADAVTEARRVALGCAWEIGFLTQGRYALDSWRIFCRDVLLGRAEDWTGKGSHPEFQPEWMRVLPEDKELRACLRWMWMREGWEWDPLTGEREVLREELRRAVDEGRVGYDDRGCLVILEQLSEGHTASPEEGR